MYTILKIKKQIERRIPRIEVTVKNKSDVFGIPIITLSKSSATGPSTGHTQRKSEFVSFKNYNFCNYFEYLIIISLKLLQVLSSSGLGP